MSTNQVREEVRGHYAEKAKKALAGSGGCCGTQVLDCCTGQTIPEQALAAIGDAKAMPDEVIATSLGCGTPLELAALKPGEIVLDLGSGGGLDCFYAARLVGPTGYVFGVDMTPEMLVLARQNKEKVGLENVEFRKGYLEALPIEDASIDVIISNCVINLSPDKDSVFREAFRVLKPGGRVAFSDEVARVDLPAALRNNMTSWSACVAGAMTGEQYKGGMERAGFRSVERHGEPGVADLVYSAVFTAAKPLAR